MNTPGPAGARTLQRAQWLEAAGRISEAAKAYRDAADAMPDSAEAARKCGNLLLRLNDPTGARQMLERAVDADPQDTASWLSLAWTSSRLGDPHRALECFTRCLNLTPDNTRAALGAATVHEQQNNLDEAEAMVERASAINPNDPGARILRARLNRRRGKLDDARATLDKLIPECPSHDLRARAAFELSRTLRAQGRHDEAFEAARLANLEHSKTRRARAIDPRPWLSVLSAMHSLTKDHCERWTAPCPQPDDNHQPPVLLVGFPRSGTTMLEQMLAAHPAIAVSNERDLISPIYATMIPPGTMAGSLIDTLDAATDHRIAEARRAYWAKAESVLREKPGATCLIDKNPMNLVMLGLINRVFPNARVIHALRDPRDVCLSCFFQEFAPNNSNVFFVTPEKTLDLYRRVMDLWLALRGKLTMPVLEARYEQTTSEPERASRALIDFVGQPWDERVLRFHEEARSRYVGTPSYEAVTQPLHTRAQGKWRRYEQQLAPILQGLRPYLERLGYDPDA